MIVRGMKGMACRSALLAGAAAALVVAGCQTDHNSSMRTDRSSSSSSSLSAMRAGSSDMAAPRGVPSGAHVMAQGRDNLMFTTPSAGTVYVYDATSTRVVWSGPARAQANVVVDPAADAVTVNDQQAGANVNPANQRHIDLEPSHDYQVWFAGR
jgi:hypothetical protein